VITATTFSNVIGVVSEADARVLMALFVMIPAALGGIAAVYAAKARAATAEIAKNFQPNGGSSPKDQWNRIESMLADYGQRLSAVEDYITNPKEP